MELIEAHRKLINRYRNLIIGKNFTDEKELLGFCDLALDLQNPDKLSRWVGYLQGILVERKIVSVESERNWSRPIYKPIYEKLGHDTTTREVKELSTDQDQ